MLDSDLAKLYRVKTFNLNNAVKRNIDRFPLGENKKYLARRSIKRDCFSNLQEIFRKIYSIFVGIECFYNVPYKLPG